MDKILIILFLLFLVAVGLLFYFKKPAFIYNKTFGGVMGQTTQANNEANTGSQDTANSPFQPINDAKNKVLENTQQTANNIKDDVYNSVENSVNVIFNKQPQSSSQPTIQIVNSTSPLPQSPVVIDLSKENNLKLTISKNSKYYLQFQNTPPNYCLYINNNKYAVDSQKTIEVIFSNAGSYPVKANSCDLNDKNIGELNVQ